MVIKMLPGDNRRRLDVLYNEYNRRDLVHPDPLEFLYDYEDQHDREIVALIASSLAYGRVRQILKSVRSALEPMKPSPSIFLNEASRTLILSTYSEFKHRFTNGEEIASLLFSIKTVTERYGSLYNCFTAGLKDDNTVLPAVSLFVKELSVERNGMPSSLIPCPMKGSACKRLNLFLRWMVRNDSVDPGGWHSIPASKLIVPLDTHMHRISLSLNLTKRRQADMRTALEITDSFRTISPDDPVKYDFALTRLGMQGILFAQYDGSV